MTNTHDFLRLTTFADEPFSHSLERKFHKTYINKKKTANCCPKERNSYPNESKGKIFSLCREQKGVALQNEARTRDPSIDKQCCILFFLGQGCALPTELFPHFVFLTLLVFAHLAKVENLISLGQGCALPTELFPRFVPHIQPILGCTHCVKENFLFRLYENSTKHI